jgi:hypothetical protein
LPGFDWVGLLSSVASAVMCSRLPNSLLLGSALSTWKQARRLCKPCDFSAGFVPGGRKQELGGRVKNQRSGTSGE